MYSAQSQQSQWSECSFLKTQQQHINRLETNSKNRNENSRAARGRIAAVNPVTALNNSWIDLTFGVKLDTETLAKAHPIYQKTRENAPDTD